MFPSIMYKKSKLVSIGTIAFLLVIKVLDRVTNFKDICKREQENQIDSVLLLMRGPLDYKDPALVYHVKKKMLHPPSMKAYYLRLDQSNEFASRYNRLQTNFVTYHVIMPIIKHLFKNRTAGFFVEAGALDGEFLSNSLYLEKDKGWKGLLVEPDGEIFKDLLKKNRKSWSINACLSTKSYPFKTQLIKYENEGEMMISTRGQNSLQESRDVEIRQKEHFSTYEMVQCIPFQTILQALNITKINFFSLDVEDVEEQILETIQFEEVDIESFVVEHRSEANIFGTYDGIDEKFIQWFVDRGYALYAITKDSPHNYFFIKNGSALHIDAFKYRPLEWDPKILLHNYS